MEWNEYCRITLEKWRILLNKEPEEREVQEFLELHPSMIPGGSGDIGPGGHHGSDLGAVFRRPKLVGSGRTFEPDFMWVTRSTSLITPILIEIEKPSKKWFSGNGRPSGDFNQARDQLNDWRSWFKRDGNQILFRDEFLILDNKYKDRPIEPQFVLIYGRDSEFSHVGGHKNPGELRYKRDQQRAPDETFITFDSLRPRFDHSNSITLTMTSNGPKLFAFSPVFGTRPGLAEGALLLGDPASALARSEILDERRSYLAKRWAYWQNYEIECRSDERRVNIVQNGIE